MCELVLCDGSTGEPIGVGKDTVKRIEGIIHYRERGTTGTVEPYGGGDHVRRRMWW